MMYSNIQKGSIGFAFAALVLLTLVLAPVSAQAADLYSGGEYGWVADTIVDSYSPSYEYSGGGEYGWVPDTIVDSYSPSYDYGSGYGYSYTPSYASYTPSYSSPSYSYTSSSASAVSSVYAPTNTCTASNSCNDNSVFNAPTVVTVTDYNNDDDDRDYDRKDKKRNDRDYDRDYKKVVYAAPAPYVSLSQVPYTGLEMGPVGTAIYWSFLVIWCLIAAYLIVVKRVQNTILNKLNTFLFGDNTPAPATRNYQSNYVRTHTSIAPAPSADATDEFVLSQINKARK